MIVMMGPPGVDLKAHAGYVSEKYNLARVDPDELVDDFIKKEGEGAAELKELIKNGGQIPEGVSDDLLRQKLDSKECKQQGWVLLGSPTALEQINVLKVKPSLILALDMSDHLIYEKLEQRRYDPVTQVYHYLFTENLKDQVVLDRLEHKEEDTHPAIKKKLLEYRQFMQDFTQQYPN